MLNYFCEGYSTPFCEEIKQVMVRYSLPFQIDNVFVIQSVSDNTGIYIADNRKFTLQSGALINGWIPVQHGGEYRPDRVKCTLASQCLSGTLCVQNIDINPEIRTCAQYNLTLK